MWKANGRKPKPQQIADTLRMEINDGIYPAGATLPTQEQLAERFGVSRQVVRQAIAEMTRLGLVRIKQGSGTVVLDSTAPTKPSMVHLAPYIRSAFEAREVTLDLFTLTAESMDTHIRTQVARIRDNEIEPPERITVRVMLPSTDALLAFPRSVDDPSDTRPLERHRELTGRHAPSLVEALTSLQDLNLVSEVSARVRTVPLTPSHKLYILNKEVVLHGLYRLVEHPVTYKGDTLHVLDVLGLGSTLFLYTTGDASGAGINDPDFVEEAQRWFDSFWDHLATDAPFIR
ncbi:GntR family transcriptional regulator [Streptomyces sp. NPDC051940]|uniref:GntR family transcriptional regulator n=1 Tax=Streptomyces sp. NPDC051940 TaxID=3155675 RepID=UPI00341EF310